GAAALADLRRPGLDVRRVTAVQRFPSGLSSQSFRVDAVTGTGPVTWVMRREPEFGVIPPYDIVSEAGLLEAAAKAGVPVPEVVHLESDPEVLRGRFLLMEFVDGQTYRSQDPLLAADPELTSALQEQFVEVLAAVHATTQDVLPGHADSRAAAKAHVAECRRRMADTEVLPHPIVADALDMLDDLAPDGAPLVLCHGDFRLPNLKWRDRRIVGALEEVQARYRRVLEDRDLVAVSQANDQSHHILFSACGNRFLAESIEQYWYKTAAIHSYAIGDPALAQRSCAEHEAMIAAIRNGDRDSLVRLVVDHMMPALQAYEAALRRW
ncbi:MAG: phosphotransferase, partial [Bauldia sp.]